MKEYKHAGETFQLDEDSKGCYVKVTYSTAKNITGYIGVNIGVNATDQNPYVWYTDKRIENYVTPEGLKFGNSNGPSFGSNLDALCDQLLREFHTQEAAKTFSHAKYCEELSEAVKNLP